MRKQIQKQMQIHAQEYMEIHAQIQMQIQKQIHVCTNTETKASALCRKSSCDEETVICFAGRLPGGELMIFTGNAMQCNAMHGGAHDFDW